MHFFCFFSCSLMNISFIIIIYILPLLQSKTTIKDNKKYLCSKFSRRTTYIIVISETTSVSVLFIHKAYTLLLLKVSLQYSCKFNSNHYVYYIIIIIYVQLTYRLSLGRYVRRFNLNIHYMEMKEKNLNFYLENSFRFTQLTYTIQYIIVLHQIW